MVRLEGVWQSGQKDYLSILHEIATSCGRENDLMTRNDEAKFKKAQKKKALGEGPKWGCLALL